MDGLASLHFYPRSLNLFNADGLQKSGSRLLLFIIAGGLIKSLEGIILRNIVPGQDLVNLRFI